MVRPFGFVYCNTFSHRVTRSGGRKLRSARWILSPRCNESQTQDDTEKTNKKRRRQQSGNEKLAPPFLGMRVILFPGLEPPPNKPRLRRGRCQPTSAATPVGALSHAVRLPRRSNICLHGEIIPDVLSPPRDSSSSSQHSLLRGNPSAVEVEKNANSVKEKRKISGRKQLTRRERQARKKRKEICRRRGQRGAFLPPFLRAALSKSPTRK